MPYKVLIPQPILPEGYDCLRQRGYEVVDGRGYTEADILADISDCDAMIVRTAKITARILDNAPKLKIITRHGAGYDGVDLETALIHALKEQQIVGAGLDVLEKEPFDSDNPLLNMENVLVAPHIGGATVEASTHSSVACAEAIDDFFSRRTPKFVVPELRDILPEPQ